MEYWTSAHLLVNHQNPYSLGEVFRMERELGLDGPIPLMLLSPPLVLPIIAPLGFAQSYALAWLVWVALLAAAAALSSRMSMDVYFGELRLPEISDTGFYRALFVFTFFPVLLCLRFAQTAPFILLGLAGFLYFEKKGWPLLAGALLSLTLIKPHLTYLVWLALLLWTWQTGRWKTLASAAGLTAVLTSIAIVLDPHVLQEYLFLVRSPYMQAYPAGVASLVRKMTEGVGTFWIQLVPVAVGLIWFVTYWRRNRKSWSWIQNLPMLLTISVFTSPYGWHFDQTLLALPVIAVAGWRANALGVLPRKLVLTYTVLNCLLMLLWALPTLALLPAPIFLIVMLRKEAPQSQQIPMVAVSTR
jgi:Glycosyltransferase family 87